MNPSWKHKLLSMACLSFAVLNLAWTGSKVLGVDQVAYYLQLRSHRPDLLTTACKQNLTLLPKYRAQVLQKQDSYSAIVEREYSDELRRKDLKWIHSHQASFRVTSVRTDLEFQPARYSVDQFVGYHIGPWAPWYSGNGLVYKIFFEFKNFEHDLTPTAYLEFSRQLARAGFHGDSKISMEIGVTRYRFNQLIVHAYSQSDALIAERVGLVTFAEKLAHLGRGIDVADDISGKNARDWHTFLCRQNGNLSRLDKAALDFVTFTGITNGTRPSK